MQCLCDPVLRIAHRFPDARLIVGDGPERPAIEMMISAARLEKHVVMMGSRDDTPAILAAMDAFLLCSNNEASPVSILEALSCEVPVIATRVGSVSESVIVGQTGFWWISMTTNRWPSVQANGSRCRDA